MMVFQNYFDVHATNGTVYVSSKLDRETAERIVIKILAEDLNAADPAPQSATGKVYTYTYSRLKWCVLVQLPAVPATSC